MKYLRRRRPHLAGQCTHICNRNINYWYSISVLFHYMMRFKGKRNRQWPALQSQAAHNVLSARLLHEVWGVRSDIGKDARFYLDHYDDCITTLSMDGNLVSPSCLEDYLNMVKFVKQAKENTLFEIKSDILGQKPAPRWLVQSTDEAAMRVVSFAVTLWLMIGAEAWEENMTLRDYIAALFPKRVSAASPISLPQDELMFNARKLYRVGGLELKWTTRITKHLHLDRRNSQLYIFRHGSMLHTLSSASTSKVYPNRFLRELAETIELLFPRTDSTRRSWDRRKRAEGDLNIEAGVASKTSRDLCAYVYWQDHLRNIQDYYDSSRPRKIRQWVYDTRDGSQQATFWFAMLAIVLTLLFGLVQSVTGILQLVSQ